MKDDGEDLRALHERIEGLRAQLDAEKRSPRWDLPRPWLLVFVVILVTGFIAMVVGIAVLARLGTFNS